MTPPQNRKDKWFMRSKDIILFLLGSGGVVYGMAVSGLKITQLPDQFEKLNSKFESYQSSAYAMETRVSLLENNLKNQTQILNEIKEIQNKMSYRIDRIR